MSNQKDLNVYLPLRKNLPSTNLNIGQITAGNMTLLASSLYTSQDNELEVTYAYKVNKKGACILHAPFLIAL
jgi:hypothetical protein